MRVAAVQLNSNEDKPRNLAAAERLVRAAAADGAELVALPEKWNLLAAGEALVSGAEDLDGPSLSAARGWAGELGIHLLAGSIAERSEGGTFNTSVLIGSRRLRSRRLPQDPHVRRRRRRGLPTASPSTSRPAPRSSAPRSAGSISA